MTPNPRQDRPRAGAPRAGVTLVEVLLAVFILGICLLGIMQGISACVGVFDASTFVKQASNVLARGDAEHPFVVDDDPVEDLAVAPDGSLLDGWTYERECLEDEDEDGLFLVRTRVARGHGGEGNEKICERLVWFAGSGTGNDGGGVR
ncbi:MAG: prepilin-type N-terminal cleavage/methylation domain-containing protein [Kiritimatiellae bacterium]|jgi:prepilin-type N-terminal cleavage/methylation domain-containing protein|nr:prepilin-type N-terminal cleavage/methylation domain-containing protein [Kiritimatiellia bacterium]